MTPAPGNLHRTHGFALLLTLVLLAIAAVAMADIGRLSLRQALEAREAEQELRRRWALRSSQTVLLSQVATLFETHLTRWLNDPARHAEPGNAVRVDLELKDSQLVLIFTDEQAKLNVNTVIERHGDRNAQYQLSRMLSASPGNFGQVRLQPLGGFERTLNTPLALWPAVSGFDQLFIDVAPGRLTGLDDFHDLSFRGWAAAELVTLWGDGRVQWRLAPQVVLEAVLAPDLSPAQVQQLARLRYQEPTLSLDGILDELGLTRQQRHRIDQRLTGDSECYGLWVVMRTSDRDWHHLLVSERVAGQSRVVQLRW